MIDDLDKKIIRLIQGHIPILAEPYARLARQLNISEELLLQRIKLLKEQGVIRRFGATLRHQEAGFSANAMVAWQVPETRIEEIGLLLAGFKAVTHCYQRVTAPDWPYNLYTMVHAGNEEECRRISERMAAAAGLQDYCLLFSEKEFKKTSMSYF